MAGSRCLCQTCFDSPHLCLHKRNPTTKPLTFDYKTIYMRDYKRSHFEPPVCPITREAYFQYGMAVDPVNKTAYSEDYPVKCPHRDADCPRRIYKAPPKGSPSDYHTEYSTTYTGKEISKATEFLQKCRAEYIRSLKVIRSPLSYPVRPPRPFDYSKYGDPHYGFMLQPKTLKEIDQVTDSESYRPGCVAYHSDGAPDSYVGNSSMKDVHNASLDFRGMPCCRPESGYHPERRAECLGCPPGKHQSPCPRWIYRKPPVSTFNKDIPYQRMAGVHSITNYQDHYREPTSRDMCKILTSCWPVPGYKEIRNRASGCPIPAL